MTANRPANRLADQTSPYLLQHAHNPVDWYPWGTEALARAHSGGLPILLSIGYAACHWCHVMERESFEDHETAAFMNDNFVCIKVDREERPDLDSIYMDAVQAMTGHGGWPMTMFLAPDGTPFYGGTYFPPRDSHGLPSFRKVLEAVVDAWTNRRDEITEQGRQLVERIHHQTMPVASTEPLTNSLISHGVGHIQEQFDSVHGGFGTAPKFPQPPVLDFLLRTSGIDLARSREMVQTTLEKMALGGIYDQLGGGFSRYSVDPTWLIPHFEKMLYDNAQLARVYTRAWQATKRPLYKRIATETLNYLLRDMQDAKGGFYASEDADSEGIEGKFYVWNFDEFMSVAPEARDYYGVTQQGNFEHSNILIANGEDPPAAARERLLNTRSSRVRPPLDNKILASWNGLAIAAFAEAGAAFGDENYLDAARKAANHVVTELMPGGRLIHVAKVPGMLEDYAYVCDGLLTLYEATFEARWFSECTQLAEQMIDLFWDKKEGGLFTTGTDHERLIVRQKEIVESATPAPNGVAAIVLQKLAVLTGDSSFTDRAHKILRLAHSFMARAPQATGTFLCALDMWLVGPLELAIVGEQTEMLEEIRTSFIPNKVIAHDIESPLLKNKTKEAVYVCEKYKCKEPITDREELRRILSLRRG
ncbi:MAG: thioredoxin domain-containing protein [Actinomycetota bacterium]